MKFKLEFTMDNDAFQDGNEDFEISRILRNIRLNKHQLDKEGIIFDINGNTIGQWEILKEAK